MQLTNKFELPFASVGRQNRRNGMDHRALFMLQSRETGHCDQNHLWPKPLDHSFSINAYNMFIFSVLLNSLQLKELL